MKNYKNLVLIAFPLLALIAVFAFVNKTPESIEPVDSTDVTCKDEYLYLDDLPEYISSNQHAMEIIRDDCSLVTGSFLKDIDSDGEDELFMQTSRLSCGTASCKERSIYIIDDGKTVFNSNGYDASFKEAENSNEFEVIEQIKYWNEPPCCTSAHLSILYRYDPATPLLFIPIATEIKK